VPFWISLGILLDPGLPSWLHISSATHSIFCVVRTVRFRPLPIFREIEFVLSISRRRSLTELAAQFLYVKWRYTVFPIVFPVELGSFHLFYLITKLLKIFARNLHVLLRIDYISACVIHIIRWHVGGFMAHSVINQSAYTNSHFDRTLRKTSVANEWPKKKRRESNCLSFLNPGPWKIVPQCFFLSPNFC